MGKLRSLSVALTGCCQAGAEARGSGTRQLPPGRVHTESCPLCSQVMRKSVTWFLRFLLPQIEIT